MNCVITISREFGSGGREFGRRLSENLGYAYYDQEIMQEIAKRTELSEKYVQQIMEHLPRTSFPIHVGRTFRTMADPHLEQSQTVFREQCNILREMAEASDCIIVGRCADYILRSQKPFRIFIYSDMASCGDTFQLQQPGGQTLDCSRKVTKYRLFTWTAGESRVNRKVMPPPAVGCFTNLGMKQLMLATLPLPPFRFLRPPY